MKSKWLAKYKIVFWKIIIWLNTQILPKNKFKKTFLNQIVHSKILRTLNYKKYNLLWNYFKMTKKIKKFMCNFLKSKPKSNRKINMKLIRRKKTLLPIFMHILRKPGMTSLISFILATLKFLKTSIISFQKKE